MAVFLTEINTHVAETRDCSEPSVPRLSPKWGIRQCFFHSIGMGKETVHASSHLHPHRMQSAHGRQVQQGAIPATAQSGIHGDNGAHIVRKRERTAAKVLRACAGRWRNASHSLSVHDVIRAVNPRSLLHLQHSFCSRSVYCVASTG